MLGFVNRKQRPDERSYSGRQQVSGDQSYSAEAPAGGNHAVYQPQPERQNSELEAYISKRTSEIDAQVEEFSRRNPDFDIRRELQNPKFCNYVWGNGLSVEDAYYLTHREDSQTADTGSGQSREPEKRVTENGTSKTGGAGMVKKNPEDMSDDEVDDIIRRVRKGEKISF